MRVLTTLRRLLREGTPWRSLRASEAEASGSTLRRRLARWAGAGLLARVHALLVGMLRGHPDLILDSCSVRARRGGDLTGLNPTDRAKRGTKYHVAVGGDGVPVACLATAANVNGTLAFERLFLAAFAVMAQQRIKRGAIGLVQREAEDGEAKSQPPEEDRPATWSGPPPSALRMCQENT